MEKPQELLITDINTAFQIKMTLNEQYIPMMQPMPPVPFF